MSKEFSPEIMTYHAIQSEVANLQSRMEKLAQRIIEGECPFKKGDVVEYSEWWRPNEKNIGQIMQIYFTGYDSKAIGGLWEMIIQPLKKDLKPHQGKHPIAIGKDKGDSVSKYNS